MAADTNALSPSITNLDNTPVIPISAGQGGKAQLIEIDDWAPVTATGIATLGSYYRIIRISTKAKLKGLVVATDKALDSGTPTLALDFGLAFSDSTVDGTLAKWLGQIPTTANNGAVTTFAAYASPNKLFGTLTPSSNAVAVAPTEILFNKANTTYTMVNISQMPLWQLFGFVDGQGYPQDPGGFFDVYAYVSTAANAGVAGNIWAKATYAI